MQRSDQTKPGLPDFISVVSPVYCCSGCLTTLADRVRSSLADLSIPYELILVCDGSPDDSWLRMLEIAERDSAVVAVKLSRNFGQHGAIFAGLAQSKGSWVIVMDCDLQDPPEAIPSLLAERSPELDAVIASRQDRQDSFLKRITSRAFYALMRWLTGAQYDAGIANFGVYSRRLVDTLLKLPEKSRFFPLLVQWVGFERKVVPVPHGQRHSGKTSYSWRGLVRLALDVITSYSDRPLRAVVKLGIAFSALALCIASYAVFEFLAGDIQVAGWTSLIASVWLTSGAVIFALGIVGLYLGQVFRDVKARPSYIVAEVVCRAEDTA